MSSASPFSLRACLIPPSCCEKLLFNSSAYMGAILSNALSNSGHDCKKSYTIVLKYNGV